MSELKHLGRWAPGREGISFSAKEIVQAVSRFREPAAVLQDPETGRLGVGLGGRLVEGDSDENHPWCVAVLPPLWPEWLGERGFCEAHGLRFPYVAGAMANGIATTAMVKAIAEIGGLGFFGAAGLAVDEVEAAIVELGSALDANNLPWGSNLIHSPHEPDLERAVADLYIRRGVRRVSASAFMGLTPALVRYALSGVEEQPDASIRRVNHVFAKISRPEVARRFMEPAAPAMLDALVAEGGLTREEAELGLRLPIAECVTVEADSGGHTDRQVLTALFGEVLRLRDDLAEQHGYRRPIHVGAAGGLGTPDAVAGAFSLGAAYVLTGSVNQACVESGLGGAARELLSRAGPGDVAMAPSPDMFEIGAEVQVLSLGTLFSVRAKKLYDVYKTHGGLDELSDDERDWLETEIFRQPLDAAWQSTEHYWENRDPREVERARSEPRHKMGLLFRSYLGLSSRWAIGCDDDRRLDYQIWCGPAMGAFNSWTEASFLAEPEQRSVAQVALNFLEGAAVVTRAQQLRSFGVPVPGRAFDFRPRPLA